MKERPILFLAPMIRALLAGTKTQTRRAAKVESTLGIDSILAPRRAGGHAATYLLPDQAAEAAVCCPYGQAGDRLWVRETHGYGGDAYAPDVHYRATHPDAPVQGRWLPSIHMRRRDSRILLEITAVRVERLQAISENDARAEGAPLKNSPAAFLTSHLRGFQELWEDINGPDSWAQNPWVWVVEFERAQALQKGPAHES